jgi:hypothetical protein
LRKGKENVRGRGKERGNVVVGNENGKSNARENDGNERRNSGSWKQSVRGNVNVKENARGKGKGKEGKRRGESSWKDEN